MERIDEPARMMTMRSLFFVCVVAGLVGCGGSSSSETTTNGNAQASTGGESETLTLAEFTVSVSAGALPEVCGNTEAFTRRCFTVDEATCGQSFQAAMVGCSEHAAELSLPETVTEANAEATATTLAQCAGQAYAMGLNQAGMMLQTAECQPAAAN